MPRFRLFMSIFWGTSIPLVCVLIWFSGEINPLSEYKLITKGVRTIGFIVEIKPESELVEGENDRGLREIYYYYYKYRFLLPNGKVIINEGKEDGEVPDYLEYIDSEPYEVEIEYLSSNPNISKVKGMKNDHTTIYEWFRYSILLGALSFLFCTYIGYIIIKAGIRNFKIEKK